MQCPMCKQTLDDDVRFCPNDGTPLGDTAATLATPPPTSVQRPPGREIVLPVMVGNRYRLEEVRGGGGMAKVYRAVDVTLERDVAVKLINAELRSEPEFDARFTREARIASQLADPHIVVVHDFGLDPDYGPFLVMELLHGQSLRERIQTHGPLPMRAVLQLAGQIFLALIHAHGKGIVHRDIKPDNVFLLNQSGIKMHLRVLDFGIARIYRGDNESSGNTITRAGAVLGTPRYMSPEQLAGEPVDARSDIFSTAILLFEALTGKVPYASGKTLTELCPDATEAFAALLEQCLSREADDRPPSALEVYLRLQELGKASGILLLPPGAMDKLLEARKSAAPTEILPPPNRSRRWLIGAVAALGAAAVVGGGLWWLSDPPPEGFPPSLLGVHIGDPVNGAQARISAASVYVGPPWDRENGADLGHLLTKEDLHLTPAALRLVESRWSADGKSCVLSSGGKVIAVVTSASGASTGNGVRIGNDVNRLFRLYPEGGEGKDQEQPDGSHLALRRYDHLGLGFEIRGNVVRRITLYPAKRP